MKNEIKEIMAKVFELEISKINDDASQENTIQWDSLNQLNLMVEIEDHFDISFTPEQIGSMVSLNEICTQIEKLKR